MALSGDTLRLGGIDATELIDRFGSPLFVMEEEVVRARARRLVRAFAHSRFRLFFAGKANPSPYLWRMVAGEGFGIDCCSPGEVHAALRLGLAPGDVSFTGTALTAEEMRFLHGSGVAVNLDAISQVERYGKLFPGAAVGLRINPDVGSGSHEHCTTGGKKSKLGIPLEYAEEAVEAARRSGAAVRGLHVHTGSGGLEIAPFLETTRRMLQLASRLGPCIEYLDLGGGLGVPHAPGEPPFPVEEYAEGVTALLDDWEASNGRPLRVLIEPGQFLACEAGWLLATVVIVKPTPSGKTFAILDTSFNHYLGTALYGSYHEFHAVARMGAPRDRSYDLVGNLCNTGDTFAHDRPMPELREGDLVGMVNAGAYGLSRSSNYNSRPIPAEVYVDAGRATLTRRRQSYDDLLAFHEFSENPQLST